MAETESIDRREVIRRVGTMLGGASLVGGTALLEGCANYRSGEAYNGELFAARDIAVLDEIADTILPETNTPGAKAAGVGPFIAVMVTDTYYPADQSIFLDGLEAMENESQALFNAGVLEITPAQRLALVEKLDREQYEYMNDRAPGGPTHYFRMVKDLTLLGYFTSEIGYTQAMRYVEAPGRYEPCVELQPGDTIWADHA